MTPQNDIKSNRLEWIDQTRGIAAIVVMLHHYLLQQPRYTGENFYSKSVVNFLDFGIFGVGTFFLISGFVIPFSIKKITDQPKHITNFLTSRFFRLYPAYWVSILILCLFKMPESKSLIANLTMFQRYLGIPDLLGVFWTLQVEWLYYFIVVILLAKSMLLSQKASLRTYLLIAFATIFLATIRFFLNIRTPLAPMLGATVILFSHWAFLRYSSDELNLKKYWLLVLTLLLIFFFGYSKDWGFQENPWKFAISYISAILIFETSKKYRLFKTLQWLGKISFSVYLVHEVIGEIFFYDYFGTHFSNGGIVIGCSIVTIAVSSVIYLLIEKPFVTIGKKLLLRK